MSSTPLRVGLLGCGVVGGGLARLLSERADEVSRSAGGPVRIARVAVRDAAKPRDAGLGDAVVGADPMAVADSEDVDLLVELMGGADRSLPPVLRALERGIPVVT